MLSFACVSPQPSSSPEVTREESREIAEEFVRNSPTFAFDGMEDTLKLVNTAGLAAKEISPETSSPEQVTGWEFTFEFDCRHAGYGDRTGQAVAQVITSHRAVVTVEELEITRAVIDGKWVGYVESKNDVYGGGKPRDSRGVCEK